MTTLVPLDSARAKKAKPTFAGYTAHELQRKSFPPLRYVVPGYIVEGLTILAGRPKLGKSWMTLDWALSVACGGPAFGSVMCEEGDVLYAALEDNERRMQRRIEQMLPEGLYWPSRLTITHSLPRLDEAGLAELETWRQSVDSPRLVAIDTFAKVRPIRRSSDNAYDADYAVLVPLQEWAADNGIAVVIVHHQRKMDAEDPLDSVSGSTGLTGAADTTLVLSRKSDGVTLYGRGRDIEEIETAMKLDQSRGQWLVLGNAEDVRRSDERKQLLAALQEAGGALGPRDLADVTGISYDNVRQTLVRMARAGEIEKTGRGKYVTLGYSTTCHNGHDHRK
ncbi:AAA family ATPase [Rhodoligotrophos defluvii]|uniref:AAA family ATPase n=1 Tax=Rhodoligotrophos defluvii TaxID=2561934 RepID=UPI0010C95180|nr:AAA family ATPase [Rhodoligotrophos defluvii]